jgi:hypothetical protein
LWLTQSLTPTLSKGERAVFLKSSFGEDLGEAILRSDVGVSKNNANAIKKESPMLYSIGLLNKLFN